jgi:hypothetical protein
MENRTLPYGLGRCGQLRASDIVGRVCGCAPRFGSLGQNLTSISGLARTVNSDEMGDASSDQEMGGYAEAANRTRS